MAPAIIDIIVESTRSSKKIQRISKNLSTRCDSLAFNLFLKSFLILALKLLVLLLSSFYVFTGLPMLRRHKLLILVPAIFLIPIFLGMIPLSMAHRLASGGPFTHCKQAQWTNYCPFNSVVSHDDHTVLSLNPTSLHSESLTVQEFPISVVDSTFPKITFDSAPLRC